MYRHLQLATQHAGFLLWAPSWHRSRGGMKSAVMWLCLLHLAFVSAGLFTRNDRQTAPSNVSVSRVRAPQSTGSLIQVRQRPLFARRGQQKRQRIHEPKPEVVPVPPPKPVKPKCSQPSQSCLPQSGCCDPSVKCHCRFFHAICFCRRISS